MGRDVCTMVRVWVQWLQNTLLKSRGTVHDWHNLYSALCIVLCIHYTCFGPRSSRNSLNSAAEGGGVITREPGVHTAGGDCGAAIPAQLVEVMERGHHEVLRQQS